MTNPSDYARAVRDRGYAVLPGLFPEEAISRLDRAVTELVRQASPPVMVAPEGAYVPVRGRAAGVHHVGFGLFRLLDDRPELAGAIFQPALTSVLRALLGDDMELELVAAIVSDETRPFLRWHSHIGGNESGFDPERDGWPRFSEVQRVNTLVYLNDIDDETGPLLVHPRRVDEPTAPPGDVLAEWRGQVAVRVPRGSVVILDQATWHAARPKRSPGLRMFVSCCFRAAGVPGPKGTRAVADPTQTEATFESSATNPFDDEHSRAAFEQALAGVAIRLVAVRGEPSSGLTFELCGARLGTSLTATAMQPGMRCFQQRDGIAYAYRGSLDPTELVELRAAIDAVHPILTACPSIWREGRQSRSR